MVNLPDANTSPEISLFAHLLGHFGERIELFDCSKATLVHVSHTIEDSILREQMPAILLTGFQESSHWRTETERYRALADVAQQICIFAGGTLGPESHEREIRVTLAGADPLRQEWFVCALTPRFSVVLCGQDAHIAANDESGRQFSTFWSFEPDIVQEVLDVLEGALAHYRPDRLAALQAARQQLPPIQPDARIMSALMREFVRFEDALQRRLREREVQYQIISELATDYIYSAQVSPNQEIAHVWTTDALAYWAGYEPGEMNDGSGWSRIIHPDDRARVATQLASLLTGLANISEFRIVSRHGEIRWVRNYARPLFEPGSGRVHEIIGAATDITAQKLHESALRVERDRFVKIAETVPGVVHAFRLAPDGKISFPYASARIAEIYDVLPEALLHDASVVTTLWHPDDVARLLKTSDVSREQLTPWHEEFRVCNPSRGELWIEGHSIPQRESDGSIVWYGVLVDITARKQAEQALAASHRRSKILTDASNTFIAVGLDAQTLLDQVAQTTAMLLGDSCSIRLRSDDGAQFTLAALYDADAENSALQRRILGDTPLHPDEQSISVQIFRDQQPLLIPAIDRESFRASTTPELWSLVEDLGIHSMLAVPLRVQGRILGKLGLYRYRAEQPPFTADDLTLAQDLADRAALALSNARLLTQLQTELAERQRTEQALRTSEQKFRQLAESLPQLVWTCEPDGPCDYLSQQWVAYTGVPESEQLGFGWLDQLHPDDRAPAIAAWEAAVAAGDEFRTEFRIRRADGEYRWFDTRAVRQTNADGNLLKWIGSNTDVTERREAEQERERARQRSQILADASRIFAETGANEHALLEQMADMILLNLGDGCALGLRAANSNQVRLSIFRDVDAEKDLDLRANLSSQQNFQNSTMIGRVVETGQPLLLPVFNRQQIQSATQSEFLALIERLQIRSILAVPLHIQQRVAGALLVYRREGARPPFDESDLGLVQDLAGRAALAMTNARLFAQVRQELAERQRAEAALEVERALLARRVEERTADLSIANAELARTARLKDEFLASMSHELRTPLNSILGRSEALQEEIYGALTPRQVDALRGIETSGRHLLDLINDILDLSKIEADKLDLQVEPVAVDQLCRSALQMVTQTARHKRIALTSTLDSLAETLVADERRLKQVLVNLLSNAVKFTPEGGKVGLEVHGDAERGAITFVVWDTGIGIAQEDLPRLFKPFVQIDSRLNRQYEGTGLGLALVLRLAEAHGGSVAVASTLGQGSRFSVMLPWSATEQASVLPAPEEPAAAASPVTIEQALVIEDSPAAVEQIKRYLSEMGVQVEVHAQANGAVERASELQPDVIVLDILLPDAVGWEVLRDLKARAWTQAIPVLIVSVVDEPERARALGAAAFLVKPIDRARFTQIVQRITNSADAPSNQTAFLVTEEAETPRAPLSILLAEDNQATIDIMQDYLHAKGYEVAVARNGSEALMRAQEIQPALILMDIQMPGMDGLEAIGRLRADAALRSIPIIAVTALAMPGDRERCLAAGADDHLTKPVNLRALLATIETHLHQS